MNNVVKLLAGAAVGFFIYQAFFTNIAVAHPLIGKWQSNKEASIQELLKVGVTSQQKSKLVPMFGKMILDIKESQYTATIDGQIHNGTYSIISESENCYTLIMDQQVKEVCLINNMMYVPSSFKGAKEVFNKI